jgi:small subunit ribosomal protein S5
MPPQQQRRGSRPGRPGAPVEEKQFDERVVHVDRVARVVKGGRRFRFRALVVIGDRKNRVGIGSSKGADVTTAVTKAVEVAKKQMISLPIYQGTFPHDSLGKVGGARIMLKPASKGTGLIAGGVVRTILEVAGISDALSKSLGSTNKTNTAYATIAALKTMEPAKNWVTRRNKNQESSVDKPDLKKKVNDTTGMNKKPVKKLAANKSKSSVNKPTATSSKNEGKK